MRELTEEELQQVNGGKLLVGGGAVIFCAALLESQKSCKKIDPKDSCKCLEYAE